jgi:hypothetical protein
MYETVGNASPISFHARLRLGAIEDQRLAENGRVGVLVPRHGRRAQ